MARGLVTRPAAVRQSLISSHSLCSRSALYYLTMDALRSPGELAAVGSVFHRVIHRCIRWMQAHGEDYCPADVGLEFLSAEVPQLHLPDDEAVPTSMQGKERLRILVTKWCENLAVPALSVVEVEHRLEAELWVPGRHGRYKRTISGQLDVLLANPPRIFDHKTGPKRPVQPRDGELKMDGSQLSPLAWAQSTIYCWLVLMNYPSVQRIEFREYSVVWDESRFRTVERAHLERLTDIIAEQVAELDAAIDGGTESQRWTETPGSHCAMCRGKLQCPVRKEVGLIYDDASLVEAVRDWHVSGEVRKDRAVFLKGVVEEQGSIYIGHGKWLGWDEQEGGRRSFGIYDAPPPPGDEAGVLVEEEHA